MFYNLGKLDCFISVVRFSGASGKDLTVIFLDHITSLSTLKAHNALN